MPSIPNPAAFLKSLFDAAVGAAAPALCLPPHLPSPPASGGRTLVIGAGKAAAAMAAAVEAHWQGALSGLVVTRYGHALPCRHIEVVEAGHPLPDAAGVDAARRMLEAVGALDKDDLLLCLISGGGSSLLTLPAAGLTLEDKQAVGRELLRSDATIGEINCVRKHLSAIKGGRLAVAAAPARVLTLLISDVPGDDPAVIASGPTLADPSSCADALAILRRYAIQAPAAVLAHLQGCRDETPKPGDPRLASAAWKLVATPQRALEAAAERARAAGVTPWILADDMEGEASQIALAHAAIARQRKRHGPSAPSVLLSGGETTVSMRGNGRGGRNAEFLLALALALRGEPGIHAIACDTDGIDGSEDNAGALLGPDTWTRAAAQGLDPRAYLTNNDAYSFFAALDALVLTGPTLTNVNDFRAVLIDA